MHTPQATNTSILLPSITTVSLKALNGNSVIDGTFECLHFEDSNRLSKTYFKTLIVFSCFLGDPILNKVLTDTDQF